jgi:hypothetical protein
MSQNCQIKILVNCLTFRNEFMMHNALMIEKTSSIAFAHEGNYHAFWGEVKNA